MPRESTAGKVEGRPAAMCQSSAGEVSEAIYEGAWKVIRSLLAASEEFVAVNTAAFVFPLAARCRASTEIWPFKIRRLDSF